MTADLAARPGEVAGVPVAVVPTRSVVEGLTALVAYVPTASLDENEAAMTAAVSGMRSGSVTRSVRDSHAPCGARTASTSASQNFACAWRASGSTSAQSAGCE